MTTTTTIQPTNKKWSPWNVILPKLIRIGRVTRQRGAKSVANRKNLFFPFWVFSVRQIYYTRARAAGRIQKFMSIFYWLFRRESQFSQARQYQREKGTRTHHIPTKEDVRHKLFCSYKKKLSDQIEFDHLLYKRNASFCLIFYFSPAVFLSFSLLL